MSDPEKLPFDTMSEAEFEPILQLLQGGNPDAIARRAGITKEQVFQMRDALLAQAEHQKATEEDVVLPKVGRNEPCPCGSGKKYKNCCLRKHEEAKLGMAPKNIKKLQAKKREQKTLIDHIEKGFGLLVSHQNAKAIRFASKLLNTYPNEDRLHDIVATSHLYAGECDKAIEICRRRWEVAKEEKAYFIEHGRYRDAEVETPSLSYYYPPMTWLQKYWLALKARDYLALYPEAENTAVVALVKELKTADDPHRFAERQDKGYEVRKKALEGTLDQLKAIGPEAIPYLLPLGCRYSWAGLFVPEIFSYYKTDLAIRALIDISMFGFEFASGASLHYLEQLGEEVIPYIEDAFSKDKTFDSIQTGIISVLGNIQAPASYDLLIGLLDHESPHVVNWAGAALGKLGKVEALPYMTAANERIGGERMIDEAIQKLKNLQAPA